MDISVGSTRVPEYSPNLLDSALRVGNRESSKCSEEQNQNQPHAAPTQSAVRFKIRSAKERQQLLNKASSLKTEAFEKASRSIKESKEETPGVNTISSASPDTGVIDTKRPRALSQLSLTKKPELSVGSETSSNTQKKPDRVESHTSKVRERTEWKQEYLSNRSKSLDWRGSKTERGIENQTDVMGNTKDIQGRSMRRSESLETSDAANTTNPDEVSRPLKRVSLQIQQFSGTAQRKQDSNGNTFSAGSGSSPVRIVALAQSFPSRLKANQSQDRTEERKNPWHSGHSDTKPAQAEDHLRSQVTQSKVNEITRNHTVMDKNACKVLENNNEASSGVSLRIYTPAPFNSVHATDSNFKRRSLDDRPSFSSSINVKTVSYYPENCGTFPKTPIKEEQMNLTSLPGTSLVSPSGKDNLSTGSNEKPLSQDSTHLVADNSTYDERRLPRHSITPGTQSLGRTRHRYFTAPISYPAFGLNNSNSMHKNTRKEIERQVEITTSNLKQTNDMETIPGKQPQSSPEGIIPQTKPQSPQSMTADSEKHHQEHGIGLEFCSSGNPSKKSDTLLEKVPEPSLASVRNTIHKFEALALQSKSSSQMQVHRRSMSVTETPKVVVSVNKTYSDRSLGKRWGDWNKEHLRENVFNKCEDSDGAVGIQGQSGPAQITTTQDKVDSTVKTQSRGTKSQEPGVVQTSKLLDDSPSDHKNKAKFTLMNKHVDEPDFSKGSNLKPYPKLKNTELTEEKVRNYLTSAMSHNSQKSSGVPSNVSHSDLKDFSPKAESKFSKPTKDKVFPTPVTVLPNSDSSNLGKSTLLTGNSAHSKSPSSLSDSVVLSPIQDFPSASGDLSNPYNTLKDAKVTEKVIRWIMDKGVDDVNDENEDDDEDDDGTEIGYDSDSGESSITITSNMSSRSFSMSLVELRSLGGLDLPPSDGIGSKDDENWMSKRTVSISSDVSALSSVTLLGMDELDCLLNDVRSLDDDALENYEDVHVIVLHKETGSGLGFTVAGGVDQNKPVTVHKVLRNGVADQEGSIHVGDQVLSINGTALHNSTHQEARSTMRKAKGRTMAVVVIRRGDVTETCYSIKDSPQKAAGKPGSRMRVTLNKSTYDLGFSLAGGVGSSLGDKPLTVQRLFQGGPVGKVFPGDELLEVEGQSLEGLRRLEVWQLIKRLPPGPVEVLLQRPHQ